MLEHLPASLGEALRGIRAGYDKIASEDPAFSKIPDVIHLTSPAFQNRSTMPGRYTADGDQISPPLAWEGPIDDAETLALIVEDPDAPSFEPFVHLLAWNLPPDRQMLAEGLFESPDHEGSNLSIGRHSFQTTGWLPPDPPTGHGRHQYVFQIFALDGKLDFARTPNRKQLVEAMKGHVLAKGTMIGLYERRA